MSIIVSSVYYYLTFTYECSDCTLNTFKTLLSTNPGILYKHPVWSFLGHRCVEKNNEWMRIHDDYQTAPNLNISMGCMLAQLMICYNCGSENVYQVLCGAFCETSIPSFVSIIIFLPLHCLHDSLEANGTRLHCFSVWVFYEMVYGMV